MRWDLMSGACSGLRDVDARRFTERLIGRAIALRELEQRCFLLLADATDLELSHAGRGMTRRQWLQ